MFEKCYYLYRSSQKTVYLYRSNVRKVLLRTSIAVATKRYTSITAVVKCYYLFRSSQKNGMPLSQQL